MPIKIRVSERSSQKKLVTLNGTSLFFSFYYNTRDNSWYFDMEDRNSVSLISGVKILPEQDLTSKYLTLKETLGGLLICVNVKLNSDTITRNNFGTNKQFQFWYYTDQEIAEIRDGVTV